MAPYEGKWEEPKLPMGTIPAAGRPRAAYAGMIIAMDRDIGRLMALLKDEGHRPRHAGDVHQRQRRDIPRRGWTQVLPQRAGSAASRGTCTRAASACR